MLSFEEILLFKDHILEFISEENDKFNDDKTWFDFATLLLI
jgi:hypothetical protein